MVDLLKGDAAFHLRVITAVLSSKLAQYGLFPNCCRTYNGIRILVRLFPASPL